MKQKVPIDAICQLTKDGEIIPIKIRLTDDDGVCQEYKIQNFRIIPKEKDLFSPDGLFVSHSTRVYECKIIVFQRERIIYLYYRDGDGIWCIAKNEEKNY